MTVATINHNSLDGIDRYKAFLAEADIEGEPKWYLGSYWG